MQKKKAISISESLEECKLKIEKLLRQNEMLIDDLARKDSIIYESTKTED